MTTQSHHRMPVAANALNRQFTVAQPNQVWAGDITDVWTTEGWLHLAARLMGALTLQALTMAIRHRTPNAGLLHHSDRGSQYAATAYQQLLAIHGMADSLSRQGNC